VTDAGPRPVVLILGGFLTIPPLYRRLATRLHNRGAADVIVAPLWTPEWLLAGARGAGRVLAIAEQALDRAVAAAGRTGDRPILVVGHSGGGLAARLLTSPTPIAGRTLDRSHDIGAIVTLGTPHQVAATGALAGRIRAVAAGLANEVVPGAWFAPTIGYVAVGSRDVIGSRSGLGRRRLAEPFYRRLHPAPGEGPIEGDGLVPLACTDLPGARRIVLDAAVHGQLAGRPWYGSAAAVDRWWPVALEAWHRAVEARGV
jgi:hypothetical protein